MQIDKNEIVVSAFGTLTLSYFKSSIQFNGSGGKYALQIADTHCKMYHAPSRDSNTSTYLVLESKDPIPS